MKGFGETYDGIVKVVVIANEVDQSNNTWCEPDGDRHKYVKMVATARKALIDANPIAIADSGIMGGTISNFALDDLLQQHETAIQNGVAFPHEKLMAILELFDDVSSENHTISLTANDTVMLDGVALDWAALIAQRNASPTPAMALNGKAIIAGLNAKVIDPYFHTPLIDIYNFHSYRSSAIIPAQVGFLKNNYSFDKPLMSNEMAVTPANSTISEFSSPDLEQLLLMNSPQNSDPGPVIAPEEIAKKYVMLLNEGVAPITLFAFPGPASKGTHLGTFYIEPTLHERNPVPENIKMSINMQERLGEPIVKSTFSSNAMTHVQSYVFEQAHKTVSVFWVTNTPAHNNTIRSLPAGCRVYDVFGNEKNMLSITSAPVFQECPQLNLNRPCRIKLGTKAMPMRTSCSPIVPISAYENP